MAARALVLFAHGARDARWREPFDRLRTRLAARRPESTSASPFSN